MYAFSMQPAKGSRRVAFTPRSRNERRKEEEEEERGARRHARLCNTFAQEVDSVEQNGEG